MQRAATDENSPIDRDKLTEMFPPVQNVRSINSLSRTIYSGAPKENIVQNHLNMHIALLNVFWYLSGRL